MGNGTVYQGVWTNHSKGPILGATLTIPAQTGNILVAVLAILVALTGGHFWEISCFAIHQFRCARCTSKRDVLFCQQQAIIRNSSTDTSALWALIKVGWAWRSKTKAPIARSFPLLLAAGFNFTVFLLAGIFSSRITGTASEALARGTCGNLNQSVAKDFILWTEDEWLTGDALFVSAYNAYRSHSTYARSCYSNYLLKGPSSCSTYAVPFISSKIDRSAPCPFADGTCSTPAISLDSGMIDSDLHLGINAKPKDRVQMRKLTTCAPIPVEGKHATNWTSERKEAVDVYFPLDLPQDVYKYYSLGPTVVFGYPVSEFTLPMSNISVSLATQPYTLDWRTSYPKNSSQSSFVPIPELNRTDADVTVLLLNNRVGYTGEVKDEWFRASAQISGIARLPQAWVSVRTLSGVACTEQIQFCNGDRCSRIGSFYDFSPMDPPDLGFNPAQKATFELLFSIAINSRFDVIIQFIKDELLLAKQLVYGTFGISSVVEPNHWQTEMENLHNISLASMQANAVAHAAPGNPQIKPGFNLDHFIVPETDVEIKKLCYNQRIRSLNHSSFSVLGLALIVAFSSIIVVTNLSLPSLVHLVRSRNGTVLANHHEWDQDDVLHLQKMALEGRGIGSRNSKELEDSLPGEYGLDERHKNTYSIHEQRSEILEPLR